MKHYVWKSFIVIAAFFIGVTINHSCGKSSLDDTSSPSTQELWTTVRSLTSEMTALKDENAKLKEELTRLSEKIEQLEDSGLLGGGSSDVAESGEKFIDGLYFSRNGWVSSKVKKSDDYEYFYDDRGRLIKTVLQLTGITTTTTYEYSGKTVIGTATITYDPDLYPNNSTLTSQSTTEYY